MMIMHLITPLFLILLMVIAGNVAWLCECSNTSSYGCIEAERNALVKFKQSFFKDPLGMLSSWKGVNCCRWKGIGCDSNTGNVIKISLPVDYNYDYPLVQEDYYSSMEANMLDSSLLQLRYLNYLDLSYNNFHATPVPEFLGALKGMKYLDLSYANFTIGTFPQQPESFTNLQTLKLSGIDLSGVHNLLAMLNKLPSLKVLSLSWCFLDPAQLSPAYSNATFFPSLRELYLSKNYYFISSPFPDFLRNMKSLEVLDLAGNDFSNELPVWLTDLKYLNHLDLSNSNFHATPVPEFLGALKGMKYLDLSGANFTIGTFPQQPENFTNLQVLNLSFIDLSGVRNLLPMLNKLPSLKVLSLSVCGINHDQLHPSYSNVTFFASLRELYLSDNNLITFPNFLKNMKSLEVLDLSFNDFSNEIPTWLTDLKKLEYLDLSYNKFSKVEGGLLNFLSGLCHLKSFQFSRNDYHQWSLESNKNMSHGCFTYHLEALDISSSGLIGIIPDELAQFKKLKLLILESNALHGPVPASIGNLSALTHLDLSDNKLHGAIPTTIGNVSALTYLDLSNNQLGNAVPDSIGQLASLGHLDLSYNNLKGNITETHFLNVSNLYKLDLSSNQLTINVAPDWIPPFQIREMDMSYCKIGGNVFPRWLRSQNKMVRLDLSNTSIRGPWPIWFRSSALAQLDLTHNEISGPIPHNVAALFPALTYLGLHNNNISGIMTISFCEMDRLELLDVSRNMLSGEIPKCLGQMQSLRVMRLSFNQLTGVIPSNIGNLSMLSWLSLNDNRLRGEIPSSLKNCEDLFFLNLGDNGFSGNIPSWIGEITGLQILVLRNNSFVGEMPIQLCQMAWLHILDLAGNNLTGSIPSCLGNLYGMTTEQYIIVGPHVQFISVLNLREEDLLMTIKGKALEYGNMLLAVAIIDLSRNNFVGVIPQELTLLSHLLGLNLSHNQLTGTIPEGIGKLTKLESLDLSNNQMFGNIPVGLSIPSLGYLNLSHNNFSGQIPTGTQLQTFNLSVYDGNPNLCGSPLPNRCPSHEHEEENHHNDDAHEDKFDKVWLYLAVTSGFGVGIWAFFGILMFKKQWRYAYFRYMDYAIDWVYVFTVVNARRLKRKMTGAQD